MLSTLQKEDEQLFTKGKNLFDASVVTEAGKTKLSTAKMRRKLGEDTWLQSQLRAIWMLKFKFSAVENKAKSIKMQFNKIMDQNKKFLRSAGVMEKLNV